MKKRILSIVLAICLVLTCIPVTVFAANTDTTDLQNKLNNGGTVKLTKDYTTDATLKVKKDVTLDLNGYVIRMTAETRVISVINSSKSVSLTLKDSSSTRKHTGENASLPDGGVITGGYTEKDTFGYGAGVYIGSNCKFTMESGTIYDCKAKWGGGVAVQDGGTFIMKGGTIYDCYAWYGGAVYLVYHGNNATMTMSGGTIRGCSASYLGGGILCDGNNIFTMTGGIIEDCKNKSNSDDAYSEAIDIALSRFIANGGTIKDKILVGPETKVENTNSGSITKFYDEVGNSGTISGGVYYRGIQNITTNAQINGVWNTYTGTTTGTIYKVSFNLNGAEGSVPTQWFFNTNKETALKPTNPTREGYEFKGWYNGSTYYNFTKPVTGNISLTAKWVKNCVSTEAELRQAVSEGASRIILVGDFQLTNILDLTDKVLTLDLNGHVLSRKSAYESVINLKVSKSLEYGSAILTLMDSNPTATHTNSSLPLGGVMACSIGLNAESGSTGTSILNADGGTVTGIIGLNHNKAYIRHTSGNTTPTAFTGHVSGSNGSVFNGIYYVSGSGYLQDSLIKGNTVTFKNGDDIYAKEIVSNEYVDSSSKPGVAVAPIEPVKDGYAFAGWYNGSTKYSFPQTVTSSITLTAKWINEVNSEATLRAALNAGLTTIKLMADINLSSALDLSKKDITLDLNGHVISGADISINAGNGKANLTLIDSNPKATHTDSTLPKGGVVTSKISMNKIGGSYNDCVLYANGGTVTSEFNSNTNTVAIKCTSNTPTAFNGKISGYAHLYGGIYYGTIASTVTIEGKKITFKNDNSTYAYEIVASGNNTVAPISPIKEGYNSFDGWYDGDTKYTFGSSLSEDITLTAKFKNPTTYSIGYVLNGGTVSPANPTGYTIESESITLNNPTKIGHTFTGWSGTGISGYNTTVTIPKGSTGARTYTANFSQNTYTVKFDTNGGSNISDKTSVKWNDKVLTGITNPTKAGYEFTGWKCGDKTVNANTKYSDLVANDTVKSVTLVAQWKDTEKPVIKGLEKGKTYCGAVEFEVSDNDGIASVKVNYMEWTPGTNGKYTIAAGFGMAIVEATDNAGNKASVTVTVNNGHTPGNDDGDCSTPVYCIYHPDTVVVAAKSHDFSGEWNKDEDGHWHICQNAGCTVPETKAHHSGTDDGDCTTAVICECGYIITAANAQHSYGEWQSNGNNTHTRYCTVDGCNGYEDGNCEGGTATYFKKAVCDTCHTEYGNLLTDITAPTGEITVGANKWNEFLNTITFGIFFKNTQSVTITASDDSYSHDGYTEDKAVKVEYYLYSSDTALTESDLAGKTFTAYNGTFSINPDNKYVVYARLTDHAGNIKYISSNGVVLDATAPVITGIENGKVYCEAQTVTVTEDYIDSVKVNGAVVSLDANNQFTLNPANGTQTIVVTDKAGNEDSVTVTVNNGHTAGNDDGNCSTPVYCIYHPTTEVVAAKSHDFSGVWNKDGDGHWHICQNAGCTVAEAKAPHSGTDDGDCTTAVVCECGYVITAANAQHSYGEWQSNGDGTHTRRCTVTGCNGYEDGNCTGGTATCTSKAICDYCNAKYGKLNSSNHTGSKVWKTTETQHKQYWDCCDAVVVNYQDHTWSNGVCSVCDYTCVHKDENPKDHECDYGCDVAIGIHADANSDHNCDYCGEEMTTCLDENPKDHVCDICGATLSQHTGGEATCTSKAICDYCHQEYGELDSSNHNLEKISAKPATVTDTGNTEYWHCLDCGKYFTDENGTNEIKLDDTVISKLPPEIIEGEGQSITAGEKKELTFRSNAAFGDFIRVELDGVTVNADNYTATEGSTIITLKADYVASLSAGEHTIGIVSESGTASTTFTVNAKAVDDTPQTEDDTTVPSQAENKNMKSPQTSKDINLALWLALLLSCGGAIIVTGVYGKRKKQNI